MNPKISTAATLLAIAVVGVAGCQQDESTSSAPETTAAPPPASPAAEDAATAPETDGPATEGAAVWAYLEESAYQESWSLWPGRGELYEGQEPHGMLLTTYVNDTALAAVNDKAGVMPAGSIVVKENYKPDETLAAVTVMYKVPGYNPDHNDWFFSKHLPDGALDKMPNGMAMEGKVPGCQACHSAQRANDYLFTGAISPTAGE